MWAFEDWSPEGNDALARAQGDLGTLRRVATIVTAADPVPEIIVAVGEPAEPPPPNPIGTCDPFPGTICGGSTGLSSGRVGSSIVLRFVQTRGDVMVELLPGETPDAWRARLFYVRDAFDEPLAVNCGGATGGGAIPTTGTLTLTAASFVDPANAHGTLDFVSSDPAIGHLTVRF